jgi:hypothetical protein
MLIDETPVRVKLNEILSQHSGSQALLPKIERVINDRLRLQASEHVASADELVRFIRTKYDMWNTINRGDNEALILTELHQVLAKAEQLILKLTPQ